MVFKALGKVVLGIFFYGLTLVASAAPDLVVGEVTGNVGDTVTLSINFSNDSAVVGMDFKLKYDPDLLTMSSIDRTALGGSISSHSVDSENGIITFLFANFPLTALSSGEILVNFIVNEAVTSDVTSTIVLKKVTFSNKVADAVTAGKVAGGSVAIKVAGGGTTETETAGTFSPFAFLFFFFALMIMNNNNKNKNLVVTSKIAT